MNRLEEIRSRSRSLEEWVLSYSDTLELLYLCALKDIPVYGWEGWVGLPTGKLTHSKRYQGTVDLGSMSNESALAWLKQTVMRANREWQDQPEIEGGELLFCVEIDP
ncbi:MAG: hypothetical protein QF752_02090 [Planctomycetota bacterium]|nr:hypothetical protein [Planctomycetota bacterium]